MIVEDVSRSQTGTQVVVSIKEKGKGNYRVIPGHNEWPRWSAASHQLQDRLEIIGEIKSVDVQSYENGQTRLQFSWRNSDGC
jgi:hypothetical protein